MAIHLTVVETFIRKHKCMNLMVTLKEMITGSLKSVGVILWESWIFVTNFNTVYSIVVEIFQSGSSGGDRLTSIAISRTKNQ